MAYRQKGFSPFTQKDSDDKKKKLLELRDKYLKGDKAKRDSIINLPIIQKELKKKK